MDALEATELAVKVARYLPFAACGVLVILSRTLVSGRNLRAAVLMGGAAAIGMVGWLVRYFLEQTSPTPTYDIAPTPGALLAVAAPTFLHDMAEAGALAVAFAAVVSLLPPEKANASQ
jgi:hypothetical protein